jgi:N-acyl-D-amino-acid deacylase
VSQLFDVLIRNTNIVDGSGAPAYKGDVAVKGERIVAVGAVEGQAVQEIDGANLVTCPGFIDMHSHADLSILKYPLAQNLVMQGVTTFVGGNCGLTPAPMENLALVQFAFGLADWHKIFPGTYGPPLCLDLEVHGKALEEEVGFAFDWSTFGEFLLKIESIGTAVNVVPLAGHNSIRWAAMGPDFKREADRAEIKKMVAYLEESLESGAFGFSTGVDYVPGEYASFDEVVDLLRVLHRRGGIYSTHHRHTNFVFPSDDPEVLPGMAIYHGPAERMAVGMYYGFMEAIHAAKKAEVPLNISHISNIYMLFQPHPDYVDEVGARATLEILDRERADGFPITFDIIANTTGPSNAPNLISLFPEWLIKLGSKESFVEKLTERAFRKELRATILSGEFYFQEINPRVDLYWPEKLEVMACQNSEYEGKTFGEIARQEGSEPVEVIFDLLLQDPDTLYWECREERVTGPMLPVFFKHEKAMIGIDCEAHDTDARTNYPIPNQSLPHPNAYGLFPHFIGTFTREQPVLKLEEAIHRTCGLPAQTLGLVDRGVLKPGAFADLVVFDHETISMKGDLLNPETPPAGIKYVFVNGNMAYDNGSHSSERAGKVLRRT